MVSRSQSPCSHSIYGLLILQGETSGAKRLQKSKLPKKLPKEQDGAGRIDGDVCSSATVLQGQDLLKDRKATTHPSVVSRLTDDVENLAKVVIDGKIITSKGLATGADFLQWQLSANCLVMQGHEE